jgi:ethanolamine ammonia-lyase small subunit
MPDQTPAKQDLRELMRSLTPARVFLPSAGAAVATSANLAFQLAHAQARDAVEDSFEAGALADELRTHGVQTVCVESAATSRRAYLMRPDLGRRLSSASSLSLRPLADSYDIVFVVADGLSARAIVAHAVALLEAAIPVFQADRWRLGPVVVVQQGRVAIGDEIGEILGAKLVALLIGERPGLSSPDSLGVYVTFAPQVGRTDAERNCLSNIRQNGMSYSEAADRLFYLSSEARRRKTTGIKLKDNFTASRLDGLAAGQSGALPRED